MSRDEYRKVKVYVSKTGISSMVTESGDSIRTVYSGSLPPTPTSYAEVIIINSDSAFSYKATYATKQIVSLKSFTEWEWVIKPCKSGDHSLSFVTYYFPDGPQSPGQKVGTSPDFKFFVRPLSFMQRLWIIITHPVVLILGGLTSLLSIIKFVLDLVRKDKHPEKVMRMDAL